MTQSLLNNFIEREYSTLKTLSKKLSSNAEWHNDALGEVILELYSQLDNPQKAHKIVQLLNKNKLLPYINGIMQNQYWSNTSHVWRKIRRPNEFNPIQTEKIINNFYGQKINEDFSEERGIISQYFGYFNPIDMIIFNEYINKDKTIVEIITEYNISKKYFWQTIKYISNSLNLYITLRCKCKREIIDLSKEELKLIKRKPTLKTRWKLYVYYNLIEKGKVDNIYSQEQTKIVIDYFKKYI